MYGYNKCLLGHFFQSHTVCNLLVLFPGARLALVLGCPLGPPLG